MIRPHLFDPDRFSRTDPLVGMGVVPSLIDGGPGNPEITGRSMATCAVCGSGESYRLHQPRAWRYLHPLMTWRVREPETWAARWLGWTSPLPPAWLWHALADGTPLCRCAHSAEFRDLFRGSLDG